MLRRDQTGWLGREDSNSQMSLSKMPFEIWREFPLISEHLGTRDFSRARCWRNDMQLPAGLAAWLVEFEPVSSNKFRITQKAHNSINRNLYSFGLLS
jgi:hypothetical protein